MTTSTPKELCWTATMRAAEAAKGGDCISGRAVHRGSAGAASRSEGLYRAVGFEVVEKGADARVRVKRRFDEVAERADGALEFAHAGRKQRA